MQKLLKDLRRDAGLTLAEASAKTGCPISTISHYERGSRRPGAEALAVFAELYGVNPENILQSNAKDAAKCKERGPPYRSLHRLTRYMSDEEVEGLLDKAKAKKDWPTVRELAIELEARKEGGA